MKKDLKLEISWLQQVISLRRALGHMQKNIRYMADALAQPLLADEPPRKITKKPTATSTIAKDPQVVSAQDNKENMTNSDEKKIGPCGPELIWHFENSTKNWIP